MSSFKKFLGSKKFVAGGSIFLLFLLIVVVRQIRLRNSIQSEISDLNKQADQLQKNNQDLQSFIAYLKTDSYKEKAAREQLNLKKPGEFVYSFSALSPKQDQASAPAAGQSQTPVQLSNPRKWWNYFFKAN